MHRNRYLQIIQFLSVQDIAAACPASAIHLTCSESQREVLPDDCVVI